MHHFENFSKVSTILHFDILMHHILIESGHFVCENLQLQIIWCLMNFWVISLPEMCYDTFYLGGGRFDTTFLQHGELFDHLSCNFKDILNTTYIKYSQTFTVENELMTGII